MNQLFSRPLKNNDGEVSTGEPIGFSGKGKLLIPIYEIHGKEADICGWLPLTASPVDQQKEVDRIAAAIDVEIEGVIE